MDDDMTSLGRAMNDIDIPSVSAKRRFGDGPPPANGGSDEKAAHSHARLLAELHHHAGAECDHDDVCRQVREAHPGSGHSDESIKRTVGRRSRQLKAASHAP